MFYEKLQNLCKQQGITLTSLLRDLELSSGNLSKWKNGARPRAATAQKIAAYLHVPLDELFQDSPPAQPACEEIRYALYHETADMSEDTLSRILEFARFARSEEKKRKEKETDSLSPGQTASDE